MFELMELILTSPVGALISAAVRNTIYLALVISDCEDCGFNDLGKLLFGGIVVAIAVGIVISVVLRRTKGTPGFSAGALSIRSANEEDDV